MNKYLVYTNHLSVAPVSMSDVIEHAKRTNNFRLVHVETKPVLSKAQAGDKILTKKGNYLYVLRTFDTDLEHLNADDKAYLDDLTRNYGLITGKKANVGDIEQVTALTQWSRSARPYAVESATPSFPSNNSTTSSTSNSNNMENSVKNFGSRIKNLFMPSEAQDVRITMDGDIAVATNEGWVSIDNMGNLVAYPTEFAFELPAYIISKPAAQIQVGDVIARDKSYVKVTEIKDGKIRALSYNGTGTVIKTVKDFFLGQSFVRVVVSLMSAAGGQMNPMMLALMSKDSKKGSTLDSMLPFMMMQQMGANGAAGQMNPMMMAMAFGDGDFNMKDMAMMSMFSGQQNPFASIFGVPAGQAAPKSTTLEKAAEAAPSESAE